MNLSKPEPLNAETLSRVSPRIQSSLQKSGLTFSYRVVAAPTQDTIDVADLDSGEYGIAYALNLPLIWERGGDIRFIPAAILRNTYDVLASYSQESIAGPPPAAWLLRWEQTLPLSRLPEKVSTDGLNGDDETRPCE
jgi:hypothetical protein